MRTLSISIYVLAAMVGVAFAVMALILVATVSGAHVWLMRLAGAFLFGVVAAHLFPVIHFSKRSQVTGYILLAIAAAWSFGASYYFAAIDDPVRNEGELFSDSPFALAFFLSIFPVLRGALRVMSIKSTSRAALNAETRT
jgi:hypothetical protein